MSNSIQGSSSQYLYPKLNRNDFSGGALNTPKPSAPPLDENGGSTKRYVPVSGYVPAVDYNHIDYKNPLEKLVEEEAPSLSDTAANVAGLATDTIVNVANSTKPLLIPAASFAWKALKGASNFVINALSSESVDPEVLRRKQLLQKRVEKLFAAHLQLENEEGEYNIRELNLVMVPAMTGFVFGGFLGMFTGGLMGTIAKNVCRAASRCLPEYQMKRARAIQIQREIRTISALLGKKQPYLPFLFQ